MASATCRMFCRALPLFLAGSFVALGLDAPSLGAITQSDISATESRVATLENTIADEQLQSMVLDGQYLAAQARLQQLQSHLADTQHDLTVTRAKVKSDRIRLERDAVYSYVNNLPISSVDSLFVNSPAGTTERTQYESVVSGNITLAVHALQRQQAKLTVTTELEQSQEQQAQAATDQVQLLSAANERAAQAAQATLDQVRGGLTQQVAQYAVQQAQTQAALAAAHHNAGAAHAATQAAAVAVALGGANAAQAVAAANQAATAAGGAPLVAAATIGSSAGAAAAAAAESQLGVPYVWGGETPGGGFDCSGLTQWSWRQAGVVIPRVAADQASAVPHVPLTELQTGDLLFFYNLDGDHQIDHVVMYVGFGPYGSQTIIQAPYTGARVQLAPLFTDGLVFAGRP